MKIDVTKLPVMKAHCKTCPFVHDQELANRVTERTLFKAHQICHGTNINRCKGSFDFNFAIYERMGFGDLVAK